MFNWIIESIIPAPQLDVHQNPTPPEQPKVQLQKSPEKSLTEEPLDFRALSGQVTKQDNVNMKGVKKSSQKQGHPQKSHSSSDDFTRPKPSVSLQNLQNLSDRHTTNQLSPQKLEQIEEIGDNSLMQLC